MVNHNLIITLKKTYLLLLESLLLLEEVGNELLLVGRAGLDGRGSGLLSLLTGRGKHDTTDNRDDGSDSELS